MAFPHLSGERARSLNFQLSSALLLQAIMPLVVEFVPTMELAGSVIFKLQIGSSSAYETAFFVWIPVINPLITMWVVKAYRRQIGKWLLPKRKSSRVTTIVNQGGQTTVVTQAALPTVTAMYNTSGGSGDSVGAVVERLSPVQDRVFRARAQTE